MNFRHLFLAMFLAVYAVPSEAAGRFLCGTSDDLAPMAKSNATGALISDLPRIPKVYSGKPTAILVRVAFTDAPYALGETAIDRINDTVNTMFRSMSRNTFEFAFRMFPTVLQAPGTKAEYGSDFGSLKDFIDGKLKEAGYAKDGGGEKGYSVYVASFAWIEVGWGGLSYGPGDGANFVNGGYNAGYAVHELGHGIGLPHGHSIEAGMDVFGTPGTGSQHVEYGDIYDIMGWGWPLDTHYNSNYKWRLGWLDKDEALEVKNTGVYRLHAHDNPLHKGRLLGIRVPSTDARYAYWFEYRSAYPGARGGAVVMFEGFQGNRSSGLHILDMSPDSREQDDFEDAVMVPGKELKDKYGTATFKVLGINSGAWNENGWVDLEVTIPGSIPISLARPEPKADERAMSPMANRQTGRAWSVLGRNLGNLKAPQVGARFQTE